MGANCLENVLIISEYWGSIPPEKPQPMSFGINMFVLVIDSSSMCSFNSHSASLNHLSLFSFESFFIMLISFSSKNLP